MSCWVNIVEKQDEQKLKEEEECEISSKMIEIEEQEVMRGSQKCIERELEDKINSNLFPKLIRRWRARRGSRTDKNREQRRLRRGSTTRS